MLLVVESAGRRTVPARKSSGRRDTEMMGRAMPIAARKPAVALEKAA